MSKIGEIVLFVAILVALLKLFVPYGFPSGFITEIIYADAFGLFLGSFFTSREIVNEWIKIGLCGYVRYHEIKVNVL